MPSDLQIRGILTPGEGAIREDARKGSAPVCRSRDMASPTFALRLRLRWRQRPIRVGVFWLANADRWENMRRILLDERRLSESEADNAPA